MDNSDSFAGSVSSVDAPGEEVGLSALQFAKICEEIRTQPNWRAEADKAADYYDDNQIDNELAEDLKSKGMGPLITNLIKPTINVVLGQEAKSRTDWRVVADAEEQQDAVEAMSAKLMEAERESRADRACSDAYAHQVKSGLGWVEVTRESDPFRYPYRVQAVHRREIHWDWTSTKPDLSDARYLVRQRWFDVDTLKTYMPEHADIIEAAGGGWSQYHLDMAQVNVSLMHAFDQENRISLGDWVWRDTIKGQVSLFEVWTRAMARGLVLDLPDGRTVELDLNNPAHQIAVAQGFAQPRSAIYSKTRVSLWVGPHKLEDHSYGTKNYPYIPFWGYREDLTGVPYGLIRSMIPLQDEVNARRRKLLWLLSSKRIRVDSDALDSRYNDFDELAAEVARPDAMIIQNPDRRNANGVQIDDQVGLANQQFEIMQESKQAIQEVAGVFNAQMGRDSSATSGLAINSLVEQGNTALADINDNFKFSRMLVGEALLDLVINDIAGKQVPVMVESVGKRKIITLNKPAIDSVTGLEYRENDVTKIRMKVALADTPSTPAYRAQQMVHISETLKSLPPELQAPLIPYYIESTDLPKRKEMAALLRKQLGLATEDGEMPDPEKQQMAEQLQMMQSQLEEVAATGAETVRKLQEDILQRDVAMKAKADEIALKTSELEFKEAESERNAMLEQQRIAIERLAQENERLKQTEEAQDRVRQLEEQQAKREQDAVLARQQMERDAAAQAAAPVEPERDAAAEMEAIKAAIEQLVKPIADKVDALAAKPAETPAPAQQPAPIINVTVDNKGTVKKRIEFEYDDKGNLKAGTATEEESTETDQE